MPLFGSRTPIDERIQVWVRGRGEAHGADIADGLRIGSGTLYPALQRLEEAGTLSSRWEEGVPEGVPRKRLYRAAA